MKMQEMPTKEIKEYILANYFDGDENVDSVVNGDDEIITMTSAVKALEKFAEYEELEEKGRLIKLPCKIGDRVYQIKPALTKEKFLILEWTIRFFKYYDTSLRFADYEDTHYAHEQDIGKTVFFTREEAEVALEKMKGK